MLHTISEHCKNTILLIKIENINQHTLENVRNELNQPNIYYKVNHDGEATVNEKCEILPIFHWTLK